MYVKSGSNAATPDAERQYYMQQLGVTSGNLFDLEKRWLESQGLTSASNTDMWIELLRKEGYTGSVSGQVQYFQNNL